MKYYSAIFFQVHCDCLDKRMREFRNLYIVYRGNSTMKPLICLGVAMKWLITMSLRLLTIFQGLFIFREGKTTEIPFEGEKKSRSRSSVFQKTGRKKRKSTIVELGSWWICLSPITFEYCVLPDFLCLSFPFAVLWVISFLPSQFTHLTCSVNLLSTWHPCNRRSIVDCAML